MPPSIFFTTKCTKCQRKKTTCMCTDSLVGNLSPWSVTQTQVAQAKAGALNWEKSENCQGFIGLLQRRWNLDSTNEREQVMEEGYEPGKEQLEDSATEASVDAAAPVDDAADMEAMAELDDSESQADREQELQAKVTELQERLLRTHADFDNFRRRARQEKEELLQLAHAKVIGELLPVLDNFALALQAAGATSDATSIAKGVEMVHRQLLGVLENLGLRAMEPIGQAFDPNLHEAVMAESVEGHEAGNVVAVMRSGYYFKEKVLRPAMVKVSE